MPIRVIAGTAKGRKLKLVPGDSTRPVMDKVKEALFNIIGRNIYGAVFLDLFAGTGSVGIEALSRGAAKAVFVDLERKAIQTIQDNLRATKFSEKAVVKQLDALKLVSQVPGEQYDFVYIAPPQYKNLWLDVLRTLDANPAWITDNTQFIVQIDPTEEKVVDFKHLRATDQRRYGNTLLWFFARNTHSDDEKPVGGEIMVDYGQLEKIASELVRTFEIDDPPVPIEIMLQRPKPDMWEEVNIADLSVGFLKTGGHYSPRMSLARLLVRHIIKSDWGETRGLPAIMKQGKNDEVVNAFGRMLVMPLEMVKGLSDGGRTSITMSMHFEVPEEDALVRLNEVFGKR